MKSRIFQEGPAAGEIVRSMRRQQGLMQLFHDYCESDSTTCEACGFLAAVEATEEAVYNSLLRATAVGGRIEAIPIDRVSAILAAHGVTRTVR